MRKQLAVIAAAAVTLTMCSVLPSQAETAQGIFGNTSYRPTAALNYSGNFHDGGLETYELDGVTVFDTFVALPEGNNAALLMAGGFLDSFDGMLWPAATVDYVDGAPDPSTVQAWQYAADGQGQVSTIVDSAGNSWNIVYDAAERIVGIGSQTITYDADGRIEGSGESGFENTSISPEYDAAGRLTGIYIHEAYSPIASGYTLSYDESGRISCVSYSAGAGADNTYFYYDSLGYLREILQLTGDGWESVSVFDYGSNAGQLGDFTLQQVTY